MREAWARWGKSALRVGVVIYALVLSAVVFTGFDRLLDAILGEDRLLVISDARLSDIHVTFGGNEVRPRPGFHQGAELTHILFAPMRATGIHEAELSVSWQAVSGVRGSVSQVIGGDHPPVCLFVLKLDADAKPIVHHPQSGIVPFSFNCHKN